MSESDVRELSQESRPSFKRKTLEALGGLLCAYMIMAVCYFGIFSAPAFFITKSVTVKMLAERFDVHNAEVDCIFFLREFGPSIPCTAIWKNESGEKMMLSRSCELIFTGICYGTGPVNITQKDERERIDNLKSSI